MKSKIMAIGVTLLLAACGFHLKGTLPQNALAVKEWRVQGGGIQAELQAELQRAAASVNPQASAEVRVLSVDSKRDIATITRAAKLNEYLYSLRVVAQAYRDGKAWGEPMTVTVSRNMTYSDSEVLGKESEELALWRDIRTDAAAQIVRRLGFLPKE